MDHPLGVGGVQGEADLLQDQGGVLHRQRAALPDEGREVLALDELHRDELDALGQAEVVDPDHVAVGDLAGEDDLLLEARQHLLVGLELGPDHLQRHVPLELEVARLVDRAHAADADPLLDPVAAAEHGAAVEDARLTAGRRRRGRVGRAVGRRLAVHSIHRRQGVGGPVFQRLVSVRDDGLGVLHRQPDGVVLEAELRSAGGTRVGVRRNRRLAARTLQFRNHVKPLKTPIESV